MVIERAHTARPGVLRADVRVRNATRDELDAHYECMAQNADVTEPLCASVVIKMYRKFSDLCLDQDKKTLKASFTILK